MVFVNILQSHKDNKFYIGITNNLENRLEKHNQGRVRSTKHRRPFQIVYYESFESYNIARLREIEIKSYKGGNKFKDLINS